MSEITDADALGEGWAALLRGEWATARDRFTAQLERDPQDPAALDGLGRALWWLGEQPAGMTRRREAYASFSRAGDTLAAANIAIYLAAAHRNAREPGPASDWLARAERLLEGAAGCAERGWLEIERARRVARRPREHARLVTAALDIARDLRDADLESCALAQLGLAQLDAGDVERAMSLLDDAMTIATTRASDPMAIGDACRTTLVAVERLSDLARAADWCRIVVEFTGRRGYTPVHLWARAVYAGVLTASGDWERAERELAWAQRGGIDDNDRAFAVARLASLRVRQGRLGEARTLLIGHEHELEVAPAAVALALSQGDHEQASAIVSRGLDASGDDKAALAALLPAHVDTCIAAARLREAEAAAARMKDLGEQLGRANLTACAEYALARIAARRGDHAAALTLFELALSAFGRLQMPLEEGRARLRLARLETGELAVLHARTALALFERLGARRDADAADALLRNFGVSGRSAPRIAGALTAREREVLELVAEGLSNQGIAERLRISPRTAEHHVGRILGKLGLRRRAEAAAFAMREAQR